MARLECSLDTKLLQPRVGCLVHLHPLVVLEVQLQGFLEGRPRFLRRGAEGAHLYVDRLRDPVLPFSVDNGVSFASEESNRGAHWRELLVERLPRRTVERLKTITLEQLEQALTVLGEFEIRDGIMVPVAAGVNLGDHRGVRRGEGRIQLGLTQREIRDTEQRIRRLVRMADDKLF